MLLNNQCITENIKKKIKNKYLETSENGSTMVQNLWEAGKTILRQKFIVIQAYLRKEEKSQVNNLTLDLKKLENEE